MFIKKTRQILCVVWSHIFSLDFDFIEKEHVIESYQNFKCENSQNCLLYSWLFSPHIGYIIMRAIVVDWLIGYCFMSISKISHSWRRHHCRWRAAKDRAFARRLWPLNREGSLSCHMGPWFLRLYRRVAHFSLIHIRQARTGNPFLSEFHGMDYLVSSKMYGSYVSWERVSWEGEKKNWRILVY